MNAHIQNITCRKSSSVLGRNCLLAEAIFQSVCFSLDSLTLKFCCSSTYHLRKHSKFYLKFESSAPSGSTSAIMEDAYGEGVLSEEEETAVLGGEGFSSEQLANMERHFKEQVSP